MEIKLVAHWGSRRKVACLYDDDNPLSLYRGWGLKRSISNFASIVTGLYGAQEVTAIGAVGYEGPRRVVIHYRLRELSGAA